VRARDCFECPHGNHLPAGESDTVENSAMTFQFLCPQGHLLQGDEAHMGMQCQCPQCGTAFIIPTVEQPSAPGSQPIVPGSVDDLIAGVPSDLGGFEHPVLPESPRAPARTEPEPSKPETRKSKRQKSAPGNNVNELALSELGQAALAETFLHIPCPNGHELETPLDMIGQRVLCPHCKVQFRLKREKSIEYQHEQEIIDRQRARFWFQLSVVVGTFVVVMLLALVVMMIVS
jgi:hypothetical protein